VHFLLFISMHLSHPSSLSIYIYTCEHTTGLSFFPTAKPANPDEKEPISQQSILMRYWYIILPLVLVGMFGGGGEEPPQQQSSTSQPQRRSKRD
jgi:hypothetical protein